MLIEHAWEEYMWARMRDCVGGGDLQWLAPGDPLDNCAGIDAWQVTAQGDMWGWAWRAQSMTNTYRAYETYTVRYRRESGRETEWHKRDRALDGGGQSPIYTAQVYGRDKDGAFLGGSACRTRDLYLYIREHRAELRSKRNPEDGTVFLVVPWAAVPCVAHVPSDVR